MMHLVPCPGCQRHVRSDETSCPFCAVSLELGAAASPALPRGRLGRAAQFAFGATLAGMTTLAACGGDTDDGKGGSAGMSGSGGDAGSGGSSGTGGTGGGSGDGGSSGSGGASGTGAVAGNAGFAGGLLYGAPPDDAGAPVPLYGAAP